ncbi:MAG: TolC family protein [Flavisolibacter sp.]|nr:TolC family protein [Flavisolibacter sp.]
MNRRRIGVLVLALLFGSITLQAQERKDLTLQNAINLSLKNSKQLKISSAKIEEATAALKEAVERRLPDASFSGSYLRVNNPNVDLKVKMNNSGGGSNPGTENKGNISQAMYGMGNVTVPLFTGFRIKYGIESSRYLAEAAKLDADHDREAIMLNTIEAFNNLYKAKAAVNLVRENLQDAHQRVVDFSRLEKNGLMARNDLLKAELQESNTELALLDAENNWKLANINMNLMLGLPENTELVPNITNLNTTDNIKTVEEYVAHGLQNRKDLSALEYRKKAAEAGIKATKGELYPNVALSGGYVDLHIPGFVTVTNAVNVGVGVKYSISSLWKTKSKVQQAEARVRQLDASEDMLNDAIRLQINQAYQNYLSSRKKIDVYSKAVAQAAENYKVIKNKYENGLATATDLLDADVAQLQAKLNQAFAQSDAAVAYNKLLQAAGLLNNSTNQ